MHFQKNLFFRKKDPSKIVDVKIAWECAEKSENIGLIFTITQQQRLLQHSLPPIDQSQVMRLKEHAHYKHNVWKYGIKQNTVKKLAHGKHELIINIWLHIGQRNSEKILWQWWLNLWRYTHLTYMHTKCQLLIRFHTQVCCVAFF